MRRSQRGSLFRPAIRIAKPVCPLALSVAMTFTMPGLAQAEPGAAPNTIAGLIADVADANQRLQDIGAKVQAEQESVNKALVDVQAARDAAAAAQEKVDASAQGVKDANAAIADAQKRFDVFAAATYVNGPSASLVMATNPEDILSTASAGQTLAVSSQKVMTDLQRARTERINQESAARLAKENADKAVADAEASQQSAVSALTAANQTLSDQQAEIKPLAAEPKAAQDKLDAARWSAPANSPAAVPQSAAPPPAPPAGPREPPPPRTPKAPGPGTRPPNPRASEWDTTLPMVPSAFVSGDPIQIINAVLQISSSSLNATKQMGKSFLQKLGILKPDDTGITNGIIPYANGAQASEYVIKRAMSQMGVPYSWGGGTATGPSNGIDSGAGTVGFDCSGLILYAFAGVGIKLPHYSGSQYNMGRKIPSSQMRRGDVIFYGPGGSQHVTLYLGQGQMLEAPYTGSSVKISPVRTSGMTPFVVRYIEY